MKNRFIEKVLSVAIAAAILIGTVSVQYPLSAYAEGEEPGQVQQTTEGETQPVPSTEPAPTPTPTPVPTATPEPTPTPTPIPTATPTPEPTATPAPTPTPTVAPTATPVVICGICGESGHAATDCPENAATNNKIYITNYSVVDAFGTPLSKVNPGDKVIIAVSVIDERIKADEFGVPSGSNTERIHVNMAQGAFSVPSSSVIDVKMRNPVTVQNASGIYYPAICYTVAFRDVTYLGGTPTFSFGISYTGKNGTNTNDNMPLPIPYTEQTLSITQATDDVPAPTVILNGANYGKVAIVGQPFALSTVATNTSDNLELDNVSLKIVLPNGITLSNGNSQVLIGDVAKGGTIQHTFNLVAEGVANDVKSLPVQLIYTYEAFVNGRRTQFTSQQDISINVQQPTRFDIQNMFTDMEMYMGNESYMSASLVNKGKTTVYNVTAELISDTLTAYDVEFLGNVMPGGTAEAEFDFTASQTGTATGKLLVTYEDDLGTQYTLEKEFSIEVMEEFVWDEPMYDEPVVMPSVEKTNYIPYIVGGAVVIGAVAFVLWKKKQKAKRLKELEDEDEDI